MGLFGSLLAHLRALRLTRKAFLYVEIGRYQEAIELLDQAIRLDPAIGDAYNELAFIHGKLMGNLDVAEKYAWQAIECEPDNPKFYNSINSILVGRAKRLKTRSAIIQSIRNRLEEIELNINADPDYPPAHLTRAVAIALIGAPQAQWESALETARSLYVQQGTSATGFKLTPVEISDIIRRNYAECLEASSCWDNTPDDFVSGNELSRHTPFALNTCHDKCYAGDATHDNHAAGRHLTRRANTSILERSRDAITSTHNSCHKSTNDLSFGKQMLPSILAQPRHY